MPQYVVKAGDTLSGIGQQYGVDYKTIASQNGIANPNLIRVGQVLNIGGGSIRDLPVTGNAPAPQPTQPKPQSQPSYQAPSYNMQPQVQQQQPMGNGQPQNAQDLINMGYGGYAGWDNAAALADFKATGGSGKGGGNNSMSSMLGNRPTIDLKSVYDSSFNTPEITNATSVIGNLDTELAKISQALADKESEINDNPYLSEATRIGRVSKLREKANDDMNVILGKKQSALDALNRLRADAETKVNLAVKQYDIGQQEYQTTLNQFNTLLSSGALMGANAQDLSQWSQATGISTSMLQSIVNKQKKDSQEKYTLSTIDDGDNQLVVAIDSAGNVVNKQVIAPSKTNATSSSSSDAKRESAFYAALDKGINSLKSGESWGSVWDRLHLLFPEIAPNALDQLLGTEWRDAGAYQRYQANTAKPSNNGATIDIDGDGTPDI